MKHQRGSFYCLPRLPLVSKVESMLGAGGCLLGNRPCGLELKLPQHRLKIKIARIFSLRREQYLPPKWHENVLFLFVDIWLGQKVLYAFFFKLDAHKIPLLKDHELRTRKENS